MFQLLSILMSSIPHTVMRVLVQQHQSSTMVAVIRCLFCIARIHLFFQIIQWFYSVTSCVGFSVAPFTKVTADEKKYPATLFRHLYLHMMIIMILSCLCQRVKLMSE